jgi:hypothetical protein
MKRFTTIFGTLLVLVFFACGSVDSAPTATKKTTDIITAADVRAYGAIPDDGIEDTFAIQKALNARAGKDIIISKGRYIVAPGLDVKSGTRVIMETGAYLEKLGGGQFTNIFNVTGVVGEVTSLTSNATVGATTVSVSSNSGLTVGALVQLSDLTFVSGGDGQNLEINEIAAINGNTISLKHPTISSYSISSTAQLAIFSTEKRDIIFENCRLLIPAGTDGGGILVNRGYNVDVRDCTVGGSNGQAGVTLWASAYCRIRGGLYHDGQNLGTPGRGYGFSIAGSSHNCIADGVTTRNVRENAFGLGARLCKITNCADYGAYNNSYNTHASGVTDCEITNNVSINSKGYGILVGFTLGTASDKRIRIAGNYIAYAQSMGIGVHNDPGKEAVDVVVENNTIYKCALAYTTAPLYIENAARPVIRGNTINGGGDSAVREGVYIINSTNALFESNSILSFPGGWGLIHTNCTGLTIANNFFRGTSGQDISYEGAVSTGVRVYGNDFGGTPTINTSFYWGDNILEGQPMFQRGATSGVTDGALIPHSLGFAPAMAIASGTVEGEIVAITGKWSTGITVSIKKHDGTPGTAQTVYWQVFAY